jgi:dCTP deaminase
MVLTKQEILKAIKNKDLEFDPVIDGFQLQPHAIDLRLGYEFKLPKNWQLTKNGREAINIDPLKQKESNNFETIKLKAGQYFEILPKEFILATTLEKISINRLDLMSVLYPRSSINRRGLAVDLSGIIDAGYKGKLVIPIKNNTNDQIIKVYPGERICQVVFQQLTSKLTRDEAHKHGLAKAKYHEADEVTSKADKNVETDLIAAGQITKLKEKYKIL